MMDSDCTHLKASGCQWRLVIVNLQPYVLKALISYPLTNTAHCAGMKYPTCNTRRTQHVMAASYHHCHSGEHKVDSHQCPPYDRGLCTKTPLHLAVKKISLLHNFNEGEYRWVTHSSMLGFTACSTALNIYRFLCLFWCQIDNLTKKPHEVMHLQYTDK